LGSAAAEWGDRAADARESPRLSLRDGTRIDLADPGVTVIVGPTTRAQLFFARDDHLRGSRDPDPVQLKILAAVVVSTSRWKP
jgi:hypothetical protein